MEVVAKAIGMEASGLLNAKVQQLEAITKTLEKGGAEKTGNAEQIGKRVKKLLEERRDHNFLRFLPGF